MRKRTVGIATAAFLAAALAGPFAGPATAAPPVGGCPGGGDWFLAFDFQVEEGIDVGNNADQNGDGLICARINAGLTKKHPGGLGAATIKDNTNR